MIFSDIRKESIRDKLLTPTDEAKLAGVPMNMKRQKRFDKRIRAIEIIGRIAPHLICENCKSMLI